MYSDGVWSGSIRISEVLLYHTNMNNKPQTEQANRIEIEMCSTEFVDCWEVLVRTSSWLNMLTIRNLSSDFVMVQAIEGY